MAYVINAASNGSAPLVVPVGGPPGRDGAKGADSTVPGPIGPTGATGRDGAQGPAGAGAVVSKTATVNVPLWTAIVADGPNGCKPADITDPAQRQQVFAVTAYGGMIGAQVVGQNTGDILGPIAGFEVGDTLFVGDDGALVSTPPTSGWRQAVATVAADGHLVINLGEATQIANDDALIGEGGFATRASATDIEVGTGDGWTNVDQTRAMAETFGGSEAPFKTIGAQARTRKLKDKILDFPLTPLDFMSDTQRAAVRAGTNTAGTSDAYEACINAALQWNNARDNIVVRIQEPAGAYVWDRKVFVDLDKGGKTNGLLIERAGRFASKHYTGPNNKYRFVNKGFYNAATNTPNIKSMALTPGDAYLCDGGNGQYNFNGISSINVGDWLYVKADGTFQLIIADPHAVRYRGYLQLGLNNPVTAFGQPQLDPAQCEYGDTWIVEFPGFFNGTYFFRGDELFFLAPNVWRRKTILTGGNYAFNAGERDLKSQGFPTDVTPGYYFIVFAPVGRNDGIGPDKLVIGAKAETSTFRAGDKIGWTGRYWEKLYASPTPRGGINFDGKASAPRVWDGSNFSYDISAPAYGQTNGVYGSWFYLMRDTAGPICGIPGPHKEDDIFFFDSYGWRNIGRDPNWDVGMLHFSGDLLDHTVVIRGGHTDISMLAGTTADEGPEQEYNNGILYRFCGRRTPVNDPGLFSDEGVLFEDANLSSDDPSAGAAQFKFGMVEKHVYIRGAPNPVIRNVHSKMASGFNREPYNPKYPRLGLACFHTHDSGFVRMINASVNARFRVGFWISFGVWDIVAGSSWEGGEYDGAWAECIDGIRLDHGYRNELPTEPTFAIRARDSKSLRYGIIINGHAHVTITGSTPIIEETYKVDGSGLAQSPYTAAFLLEHADNVLISCSIPNGGFDNSGPPAAAADQNPNWKAAFLRVKGPIGTVWLSDTILSMNAGVGIDTTLADRRTMAKDFPAYTPSGEPLPVSVNDASIVMDGFTMDGLYNAQRQGFRALAPVVDPCGIVTTRGVHREGVGPSAPHAWGHTSFTTSSAFDPILSVDRDRADFATFQSGELGKVRIRGKDTGGIRREGYAVTAQWAGNSTPVAGATLVRMNGLKNGAAFTFMDFNGQTQRATLYENVQLNAKLFFGAALVDAVDDTAAASAGVAVGQTYRSGSALRIRVA